MALSDDVITLAALVRLDLPGGTVRLTDGGQVRWGAADYLPLHPQWGAIAGAEAVTDALGDQAQDLEMALAIPEGVALSSVYSADVAGARVLIWLAEVSAVSGLVVGVPVQLADMIVDVPGWDAITRTLELALGSRADRLFRINRGNAASNSFHQSVWPGELGFANCSDVPVQVAWGTAGPPRGVSFGGGVWGGGGGGGGGGAERGVNYL